jgi:hypothetical protein
MRCLGIKILLIDNRSFNLKRKFLIALFLIVIVRLLIEYQEDKMYKSLPLEKMKTNLTYEKTLFLSFEFNVSKTLELRH